MSAAVIDLAYLRECFDYDALAGRLYWKSRPLGHFKNWIARNSWNARYAGTAAGCVNQDGYLQCKLARKTIKVHAVCWAISSNKYPVPMIDHKDRNPLNNALDNLRECTKAENAQNMRTKPNSTGFKGVRKSGSRFTAQIRAHNKKFHLGSFESAFDAHQAYKKAALEYHGEFANLGAINEQR